MGGYARSEGHRGNPESSESRVPPVPGNWSFVHGRGSSTRYKGRPVSEFQEIYS